ncbi:MAG: isoprenyl transferase [Clostridia bacterium]
MAFADWLRALGGKAVYLSRVRTVSRHEGLPARLPRHVAVVMDGNGRWAEKRGLPRSAGHSAGVETLRDIIRASSDWGIGALSIYAFSQENWQRPAGEVNTLMGLLLKYFLSEIDELDEKNVRILILGDVPNLPAPQREAVENAMARTQNNTGLHLNIALNYGGRQEILHATRQLIADAQAGKIDPGALTQAQFADKLYTRGQPDVDLFIRTSGEVRTSNFLPWQTAYAEMIFNPILWPDYTREVYREDLWTYAARDRRFGKVKSQ